MTMSHDLLGAQQIGVPGTHTWQHVSTCEDDGSTLPQATHVGTGTARWVHTYTEGTSKGERSGLLAALSTPYMCT
jgi:hypothetical protein